MRIALLENDADLATRVTAWLADDGHLVTRMPDAASACAALAESRWDLLIVDVTPAVRVTTRLRRAANRAGVPLLCLVDRGAPDVDAGDDGAAARVTKPLRRRALAEAVRSLRRAPAPPGRDATVFGAYLFDVDARRVTRDGREIHLTRREFDLALYLFRHPDRVLSRAILLERVWGPQRRDLDTRTVDTHVSRVRRKLGMADSGWRLAAVYDHGYRLESPKGA